MKNTEQNEDEENPNKNKKIKSKKKNAKPSQSEKREEQDSIFGNADALTPKELKEKNKQKEKEIFEVFGGGFNSIKKIKDFKAENRMPYAKHFGYDKPYYLNIFKLNKWPEEKHKEFVKPPEVASWTMSLIYGRFGLDVVKHLRARNPTLFAYIRVDKYFQYLNEDGQRQLDEFIDDFIRMSIGYDDWNKFEADYRAKHKLPSTGRLFK